MKAHQRMTVVLVTSLLLWGPIAYIMLTGGMDFSTAGLYYVVALGLSWMGTSIFSAIARSYRINLQREFEQNKREIQAMERQGEIDERAALRRRSDDPDSSAESGS